MEENIVELKKCTICNSNFEITSKDLEFLDKISPVFDGIKYSILLPTLCPDCRMQRRLSFRNERKLYKRKCDATNKNIISIYSPDKKNIVFDQDYRWSDNWDEMDYGICINLDKSFFEQFKELSEKIPKRALVKGTGSENSDYANGVGSSKNCYLMFDSTNIEECYYGNRYAFCTNCIDCTGISNSEKCYDLIDGVNCFQVFHSRDCLDCSNSSYLYNCTGCSNCFGCVNLSNKEYYIFNKKYTRVEYKKEINSLVKSGYNKSDFYEFTKKFPNINLININSENVFGDKIYNSNNIYYSFDISDSNNINYSSVVFKNCSDVYDSYVCLNNSNHIYESIIINKRCSNLLFCDDCWNECSNLIYCSECKTCKDCFLCTGLRDKQYCILNVQYTKEDYNKLVPQIINIMKKHGEWGEFFSAYISAFGYNETAAIECFPLKKEEVLNVGFNYSNFKSPSPKAEKIIPATKLPKNIKDIPDDMLNWAIECEITKRPFKIIKGELDFYRKYNILIPKKHPDVRHIERINLKNSRKLFDNKCNKCFSEIKTSFNPEGSEIIYCKDCYNKFIY